MQDDAREIANCLQFGRKSKQYNDAIRSFALTTHFYSPRAYNFIRNKFNHHLPDVSCMRSWISNCTGFQEPGICIEGIKFLGDIADEMKSKNKEFICSMSFDEMHIRRHVQWSDAKKKFQGFISYGKKDDDGEIPVAQQALVFLITGVNFKLSIPIAYFFIKKLNGTEKSFLIKEILREVTEVGVRITNITFDGDPANFAACSLLGASFSPLNLKPYFLNPVNRKKVYIILDACHILKLIRNCLGHELVLQDDNNDSIKWCYFDNLEKYRVERNFVTHKITKKHIEWYRSKMTVKYAAELFSKSVSDSLNYLNNQKCNGFENCEATARFTRIMNDLFDIFNSIDSSSKTIFKETIKQSSANAVFAFLDQTSTYLRSLKINGKNVLKTKKKTGFNGFLINIESLKGIYAEYVETGLLAEISTYQLSQDSLESLFSRVRSLNGNNDNPNVIQFTSAFRKIHIQNEITSSQFANCADKLKIFSVSSRRPNANSAKRLADNSLSYHINVPPQEEDEEHLQTLELNENDFLMDCCEEITIASIAGSVEQKILEFGRFECECKSVLLQNEKVTELTISNNNITPCESTVHVCKVANICFNHCRNQICFDYETLIGKIMNVIDFDNIFSKFFVCDISHKKGFVKYIVQEFIRLQATYIAKNLTLIEQKILCRKQLKKKIHFLGQ